ncbi:DNA polymerase ligase N-terminal domain-containing protein [Nitratireductor sp. GISD-1A_MAKvit]|uniref:DNA polymerase ligase N-terminal domain-containing protein n=1 Tax=Nitratireductor sp. GISD-1A_MAKvit TaxID=3234198 RepID=UPI003467E928
MATRSPQKLLREYRAKRDFSKTTEPQHRQSAKNGEALSFVVQKHDASRLHYDFRLEWEGVLKSWAVTKGPSLDPSEKRLAVRTEDHPLSYGTFEGIIPESEYGGGTVMLWDRGHWEPEGEPGEGLKKGKLTFLLHGERLGGKWSLVRMKRDDKSERENWLLIKADDDAASKAEDVLKVHERSVETKRSLKEIAEASDAMPGWREPQLATLVERVPGGSGWLTEMKYDGYRALLAIDRESTRIFTRNGKDWTDRFPDLAAAAAELDTSNTLLDGEIVAFNAEGHTDFSTLQRALSSGEQVSCFVFDLLVKEGLDLTDKPLRERKKRLERLLKDHEGTLLYSAHTTDDAGEVLTKLCKGGHEGIIVKNAEDPYRPGPPQELVEGEVFATSGTGHRRIFSLGQERAPVRFSAARRIREQTSCLSGPCRHRI